MPEPSTAVVINLVAVPPLLAGVATLALGTIVLARARRSPVSWTFFVLACTATWWLFGTAGMYLSRDPVAAMAWQRFLFVGVCLVPAAFFHFAAIICSRGRHHARWIWLAWLASVAASSFTLGSDLFFSDVVRRWWGFYPEYRRPALIFLAFFALMIVAAMREFDRERRDAPTLLRRRRAGALLVAFSLSALAAIDFLAALRLPIFPLGSVFVMAAIAVAAWTLQRYRFVGLAPEFVSQEVLATMADGLAVCDASGRIRVTNHGLRELLGYAPGALEGRPIDVLVEPASPEETRRLHALLDRSQVRDEETTFRTKSGTPVLVSVALSHVRERHGSSVGTVLIARDTRERHRANQELKRYARQQEVLTDIGLEGLRCREPDGFMRKAAEAIGRSLQADRIDILEFIDDTRRFHWVAGYGSSTEAYRPRARTCTVDGLAGYTLAQDGVVIVEDATVDGRFTETLSTFAAGTRSAIGTVVRTPTGTWGVILAESSRARHFQRGDGGFLESVANVVGHVVERARVNDELREQAATSTALAHIGQETIARLDRPDLIEHLCKLTCEAMGSDSCFTLLWDEPRASYVCAGAAGGSSRDVDVRGVLELPRETIEELFARLGGSDVAVSPTVPRAVALAAGGADSPPDPCLCMALRRGDEIIGALVASWHGPGPALRAAQWRIGRGISQIASFALENARLVRELGEADRIKSDFVATMSHELRTPLGVVIGYTDLLVDGELGALSQEQGEVMHRIRQNAITLLELINSTLDMSRLQQGRVSVEASDTDVEALLRRIDEETWAQQEQARVEVVWQIERPLPRLWTDSNKLKVVLKNLLVNALKFTEHGSVTLAARAGGGGFECVVRDTGPGISAAAREAIFEPFWQGGESGTRGVSGVGLGLYIVRRLVDMLGGTIELRSELGHGSEFHVRLPTAAPVPHESPTPPGQSPAATPLRAHG